jgi:hypothetical protein
MLFANELASRLKESLAYSLVSLYFSLRRVSLAEYILILNVCFSTSCRWGRCTMVIVSTACILQLVMTRTKGMVAPYVLPNAFVGHDYQLAL